MLYESGRSLTRRSSLELDADGETERFALRATLKQASLQALTAATARRAAVTMDSCHALDHSVRARSPSRVPTPSVAFLLRSKRRATSRRAAICVASCSTPSGHDNRGVVDFASRTTRPMASCTDHPFGHRLWSTDTTRLRRSRSCWTFSA